jgi:hypothetical protein
MTGLLEPTEPTAKAEHSEPSDKAKPDPQNEREAQMLWQWLDIPGRSINPEKLTAFLRSNFGFGAYDIMVRDRSLSLLY